MELNGRSAARMEAITLVERNANAENGFRGLDARCRCAREYRPRPGRLCGSHTRATLMAAAGRSGRSLIGVGRLKAMTVMLPGPTAAQVFRQSRSLYRHRKNRPGEGEQQQKLCSPTLHVR